MSIQHIFDSIKASLKRLQMDHVDVLQCHGYDDETPIEETVGHSFNVRFSGSYHA